MGDSSSTTTQQSQSGVGAPAQGEISGLLSNLQNLEGTSGLTPAESSAIGQLTSIGAAGNPYAVNTSNAVNSLLTGGNATSQNGNLATNLANYTQGMSAYTDPNYSTLNSPAVQAALQTIQNDTTNSVNGQFAASGRSGSGMNTQTLARGIAQGEAPVILNQANTDTATRQAALNGIYGAGNTTAGAISANNQNAASNENAGIGQVGTALNNSTWGPQTVIEAQQLAQSIPTQNLGLLAQIGVPLAQLYSTSNGTQTTNTDPSLLSDLSAGSGIVKNLFGTNNTSGLAGLGQSAASAGSGLLGLLAAI